jgi:transposase
VYRISLLREVPASSFVGLTWPLPPELDDDVRLENRLYPPPSDLPSDERPQPDWAVVHRELRRPSVTLMLLWEEYCDKTADGFSYSWFCERYKDWTGRLKLSLRQISYRRREALR